MIRVLIVARSDSEAEALAALLEEDERIETVEPDGMEPDVMLVSGQHGGPADTPAVVLTDDVFEASDYRTNVRARLPVNAEPAEILAAITAAAQGLVVLTQAQADSLFAHPPVAQAPEPLIEELTPRELQVLREVAQGWANKEVAEHLAISEHTVKFHVAAILGKLGVGSRTEAVTQGIRRGLIPI